MLVNCKRQKVIKCICRTQYIMYARIRLQFFFLFALQILTLFLADHSCDVERWLIHAEKITSILITCRWDSFVFLPSEYFLLDVSTNYKKTKWKNASASHERSESCTKDQKHGWRIKRNHIIELIIVLWYWKHIIIGHTIRTTIRYDIYKITPRTFQQKLSQIT